VGWLQLVDFSVLFLFVCLFVCVFPCLFVFLVLFAPLLFCWLTLSLCQRYQNVGFTKVGVEFPFLKAIRAKDVDVL